MLTFRSILDALRETALSCIGSPHARSRQLAALRRLDDRLLKDIGLTVEEVKQATLRQTQRRPAADRPVSMEIRTPSLNR